MDSASTKYSGAYRQWKGENQDGHWIKMRIKGNLFI